VGENFRELVENKFSAENNFVDCSLVLPNNALSPNFAEKTFQPWNLGSFLPRKFPTIQYLSAHWSVNKNRDKLSNMLELFHIVF